LSSTAGDQSTPPCPSRPSLVPRHLHLHLPPSTRPSLVFPRAQSTAAPWPAERSSLPPAPLLLLCPFLLSDTSLSFTRVWAGHAAAARPAHGTSARSPRRGRRREPGSCGQKATDVHRPCCGWPRMCLSAVQVSSHSIAVGRRQPAGETPAAFPPARRREEGEGEKFGCALSYMTGGSGLTMGPSRQFKWWLF
jgi:hypothetical protein